MTQYKDYECTEGGCVSGVGWYGSGRIPPLCPEHKAAKNCGVEGCAKSQAAAELCSRHYDQARNGRDPHTYDFELRACLFCSAPLAIWTSSGPRPKLCSEGCRKEYTRTQWRDSPSYQARLEQRAQVAVHCVTCGVFLRAGGQRGPLRYCAPCRLAVRRAQPKDSPTRTCEQPECDRPLRARGRCSAHYKVWLREQGRMGQSGWDARRKANRAVRDQHVASRRTGTNPTVARLVARDGTDCGWCGQPLDMTLTYPHRMYRTIDHVLPLSKGGEHSMDNTRLLHWTCNSARSNSDALTKSDAMVTPFPTPAAPT